MQLAALVAALPLLAVAAASRGHDHGLKRGGHAKRMSPRAPLADADADLTPRNITKRDTYSGRGTYFYVGLGACGETSVDSDLMVALNTAQYGSGYPGPECFKYITVEANGVTVSGIEILDECPTCDYGGLDMSPGLFTRFADESVGVLSITWWFEDDSSSSSSSTSTYQYTPTTTSTWQYTPTTTSTWQYTPTTTSTWVAPTSTYTPPTSTWVAPTSTWVAPSSTSTWVAPSSSSSSSSWSSWSSAAASSSWSSAAASASLNATIALNASSADPFNVISSTNATASVSGSAALASASAGTNSTVSVAGSTGSTVAGDNLVQLNALTAQYGQLVVVAAKQ